ncbi:MAG: PAS-domain containing protein, partial [Bdellovibrionia bacterium]
MSQLTSLIHFFRNKPSNHNTEKLIKLADRKINAAALLLASTLFLLIVIPYSLNEYSLRLRDRESDILAPFERSIEQIERALIDIDNDQLNYFIDQKKENLLNFQIYQNILTTELKQALKYTNDIGENAADLTNSLLAKVQLWTVNYAHPLHQEALRGDISLPRLNSLLKSGRITLDSARRSIEQIRTTLARKRNTTHLRIAKLTRWSLLGTVILGFLSLFANAYLFRFSRHTANLYRRAFKNYQTSTGKASQLESQLSFSQALLKNTPLGIAVIETRDLTVKYGNHAFERLPFLKSLDVLHQSLKESLNDGPATRQFLNTIEKTDCSLKQVQLISNVEYNSPGSMPSFWNFRAVPFGEKEGATAEHLLLIWDDISVEKAITEQIKNERQEASHREFELQVILDHMDDGVIVVNAQNEMTLINSQARLLLNIPKDLRLPQPVSAFPKEVIQAMSVDEWPKPIEKDSSVQFEKKESRISFYPASGRLLEMITTPSRDDSFNLVSVVAVLHDITAHKKAEKEKDEFLSVASHEL